MRKPQRITIDFETRSFTDLTACGAHEYAVDPSTDLLCVSWAIGDGPVRIWSTIKHGEADLFGSDVATVDDIGELFQAIEAGAEVEAHNASFEREIWSRVAVPRYGFPEIPFDRWSCSMAKAARLGLPQSLDGLANALGLAAKKDSVGHRIMLKLSQPKPGKTRDDAFPWHEKPDDLVRLFEYCKRDVEVEREASEAMDDLPERERRLWLLDQRINARGIPVDRLLAKNALAMVEEAEGELAEELRQLTDGVVDSPTEVDKLKDWLADGQGVATATLAAAKVESLIEDKDTPVRARRALEIRRDTALTSTKKLVAMLDRSKSDGRVRYSLRYHGAFTGRWSGSGLQIQNFPRGEISAIDTLAELFREDDRDLVELFFGSPIAAAKSALRPAICAPDGRVFLVWDYGQIEARALAWLAGETSLLRLFARGEDPYRAFAAEVFGKTPAEISGSERFVGKTCVLGLGYGMGAKKFRLTLAGYKTPISEKFAAWCVDVYRSTYSKIKAFWKLIEQAAFDAMEGLGSDSRFPIQFRKTDRFLICSLPSGREIFYLDPGFRKKEKGVFEIVYKTTIGKQLAKVSTYGGKLTENVVQAIARDLMVDGLFRLDAAGFEICATVHDEVISETDEANAEARLDEGRELLSMVDKWATGLPLVAEGFISKRYKK